jgi:hypothetical protein
LCSAPQPRGKLQALWISLALKDELIVEFLTGGGAKMDIEIPYK